jgi:hypothetical protein
MRFSWRFVKSKTTVHASLVQELHMNRICERWVPRMLSEENMTNRTEASRKTAKSIGAKSGLYIFFPKDFVTFAFLAGESKHFSIDLIF